MPITASTNNNFNKVSVSGNYTGTRDKDFKIKVFATSATKKWRWKYKEESGIWSDWQIAETAIVVNTDISLSDGVVIKFTNTNQNQYNTGDIWTFTAYANYKLSNATNQNKFHFMDTIVRGDETDLVLFSKAGNISLIKDYESSEPEFLPEISSIHSFEDLHAEKKNKELYISSGKDLAPKWVGYSGNNGFAGTVDENFITAEALDKFDSSDRPDSEVFDKFVTLRGGAANTEDSKLLVGINTEGDRASQDLMIYNVIDNKLYKFTLDEQPTAIRKWYKKNSEYETGHYGAEGIALLLPSSIEDANGKAIAEIQFWHIPNTGNIGQNANLEKRLYFEAPTGQGINSFFDFLIVPNTSAIETANTKYTIILATNIAGREYNPGQAHTYEWLWKLDSSDYDWEAEPSDELISDSNYVNITPKLDFSDHNENDWDQTELPEGGWCYLADNYYNTTMEDNGATWQRRKVIPAGSTNNGLHQKIIDFPKLHCLEFGGYDGNGGNPVIMWTVRFRKPRPDTVNFNYQRDPYNLPSATLELFNKIFTSTEVASVPTDTNGNSIYPTSMPVYGPVLSHASTSEAQRVYRAVEWGTYAIPFRSTSGFQQHKLFCHFQDWATTTSARDLFATRVHHGEQLPSWLIAGEYLNSQSPEFQLIVPSQSPNFDLRGRFHIYGNEDNNCSRAGLYYYKGGTTEILNFRWNDGTGTYHAPEGTPYSSVKHPGVFPNRLSTVYDVFNKNIPAGEQGNSSSEPISGLPSGSNHAPKISAGDIQVHDLSNSTDIVGGLILVDKNKPDDKNRWRISEGHRQIDRPVSNPNAPLNSQIDRWYPNNDEALYINAVPFGGSLNKAIYKLDFKPTGTDITATPEIGNSSSFISVVVPESGQPTTTWKGPNNIKKLFYKISFIYDGYQESPLLAATGDWESASALTHQRIIDITISDSYPLNQRITGVALYRAYDGDENSTDPENLYRFIEEIPMYQFNFSSNSDWTYRVTDTGDSEATYESLNDISEKSYDLNLHYKVSTQQNGYLFASNAHHEQIPNADNYLFRSKPGKYSIFDWTRDFTILPITPTCLKGFMGKVYAFNHSMFSIVNPESLFIEDTIEGIGCLSQHSIKISDAGMFWCDYKNIYISSPKILPIGDIIKEVETYGWNNLTKEAKDTIRIGYDALRNSFLIFFTLGDEHKCWAYSVTRNRWDLWETEHKVEDTVDMDNGGCLILQDDNTIVHYLGHPTNKRNWSWESKKLTYGRDLQEKRIRNIKISSNSRADSSIQYKVDNNYSSWNNGIDISTKFPGTENSAIKLASSDGVKHYWAKYKISGTNDNNGKNTKVFGLSTIYKAKRYK